MLSSSLLTTTAALAALASAMPAPQSGSGNGINTPAPDPASTFYIAPQVVSGNGDLCGRYLSYFHTGAGEATLTTTTDKANATHFYLVDGRLASFARSDLPPSTLGFEHVHPYLSDAPAGYDVVSFNLASQGDTGFSLVEDKTGSEKHAYVAYDGSTNKDMRGWALCAVNGTSPYFSVGPQVQLLWRTPEAQDDAKCANVALQVQPTQP